MSLGSVIPVPLLHFLDKHNNIGKKLIGECIAIA